jgi:hypothetical protein
VRWFLFSRHDLVQEARRDNGLVGQYDPVLNRLFEDHAHIAKVLDFISEQAQLASRGGRANLEALISVISASSPRTTTSKRGIIERCGSTITNNG